MRYIIDQCVACGSCYQREILNSEGMELLYGTWISPKISREKVHNAQRQVELARHIARILRLFPNPSAVHLLDYGMGWGDWCHMAQSFGFNVTGVELDRERINFARSRGIEAYRPDELPQRKYDFIYLAQVLEHLPEPHDTVQKMMNRLQKHGYIHIGVPDGASVPTKIRNTSQLLRKGPAQPLEHINIFSRASLVVFMQQFGCKPVAQREALLRCASPRLLLRDSILMAARFLPASIFPSKTNLLFQQE